MQRQEFELSAPRLTSWLPSAAENGPAARGTCAPSPSPSSARRCHLSSFKGSEQTITCTAAAGLANAKARAKALWAELKQNLKAGKHVAIQARELWSTEERRR